MRRAPIIGVLVIGLGLIAAPGIFQMFTRAPLGGKMIDEFGPFMTKAKLGAFDGYIRQIGEANRESRAEVPAIARERLGVDEAGFASAFPAVAEFNRRWAQIDEDMTGMLRSIDANRDNYAAVAALPPFPLFPWFFVLPGLILAGVAASALRARRAGAAARGRTRFLAVVGVGLIAAPAIFQMFTRAPLGNQMIDDFKPIMTAGRVTSIQGYFLVIGSAEGELRTKLVEPGGVADQEVRTRLPAVARFLADWQTISSQMAPMIGAMADNLDNFAAVAALPPFSLFPWFFVFPGLLVAALALAASRPTAAQPAARERLRPA